MWDREFEEDLDRSFTPTSDEELSEEESGTFSTIMEELNAEVDRSAVFGVGGFFSHRLMPFMYDSLLEAHNVLHISDHLKPRALQEVGRPSDSLQQQLRATEEENHALREALKACEACVQKAEREKQQEVERKEECEKKMRDMKRLFNGLELTIDNLKEELKMSQERKESLKRTTEKAKMEASEAELKLRTDIIVLKEKIMDQHAILAREQTKSMKTEMELEATIKNLRNQLMRYEKGQHLVQDCLDKQKIVTEERPHMVADLSSVRKKPLTLSMKELRHLQHSQEEKLKICTELQKKLCTSEDMAHSLHLQLSFSQRSLQSLRNNL